MANGAGVSKFLILEAEEHGLDDDFEADDDDEYFIDDEAPIPSTSATPIPDSRPPPPRNSLAEIIQKWESYGEQCSVSTPAPPTSNSSLPASSSSTPAPPSPPYVAPEKVPAPPLSFDSAPAALEKAPVLSLSFDSAAAPPLGSATAARTDPKGKTRADLSAPVEVSLSHYLGSLDVAEELGLDLDPHKELGRPDTKILGLMEELWQKSTGYNLLNIYSVRCRRGSEDSIYKCIRRDINSNRVTEQVLWNVYASQLPGQIYLHVHNMLPVNTHLAAYLREIDGFIYPTNSQVPTRHSQKRLRSSYPPAAKSTDLVMPLHQLIPWPDGPSAIREIYRPNVGDWVRICGHNRLYTGDVGLVYECDADPHGSCWVLLVPRLLIPPQPSNKCKQSAPPKPTLYSSAEADRLVETHGVERPYSRCIHLCTDYDDPCPHSEDDYRVTFLDQTFDGALVCHNIPMSFVEPATTIPAEVDRLFRRSGHSWLTYRNVVRFMPPSSDWAFSPEEKIVVFDPANLTLSTSTSNEMFFMFGVHPGTEGVITTVQGNRCEISMQRLDGVRVVQEERFVPQSFLRKKLDVGDNVKIVAPGATLRRVLPTGPQSVLMMDPDWTPVSARGEVGSVIELQQDACLARVVIGKFEAVSVFFNVYLMFH
jgi:hypothetical protein